MSYRADKHGHTAGGTKSREYTSWHKMRERCLNPKQAGFSAYGGRGISVCPQWEDFKTFLADMGNRPQGTSLDRIDNDGNYEPSNCRWATVQEQYENTSKVKLCRETVARIRDIARVGGTLQRDIADYFGVDRSVVCRVINHKAWS